MRSSKCTASIIVGLWVSLSIDVAAAEVVAVVSVKSEITTLSKNQVTDIFLGKTSRFPDGTQATPIDQLEGSPVRDEFYSKYSSRSPAQIKAYWSKLIFTGHGKPPPEVSNDNEVKKRVIENPNVIGYIDRSLVDSSVKIVLIP